MSLKTRMMVKVAKKKPHYVLFPLVPLGLTIGSFVMSFLALRRTSRLTPSAATPPG